MVEPFSLNFRVFIIKFVGVQNFWSFMFVYVFYKSVIILIISNHFSRLGQRLTWRLHFTWWEKLMN